MDGRKEIAEEWWRPDDRRRDPGEKKGQYQRKVVERPDPKGSPGVKRPKVDISRLFALPEQQTG